MRNLFASFLQTFGYAGRSIRDAANMEVYRKYTGHYNNFQILKPVISTEGSTYMRDFKGVAPTEDFEAC